MRKPVFEPDDSTSVLMHHSEAVDSTLAQWINDLLNDLLGWGPWTFVIVLGIAIVLIPLWLIYNAIKHPAIDDETDLEES